MNDNKSAFRSDEYDRKIKQTLPYYDEFYEQVIDLVKISTCAVRFYNYTTKLGAQIQ